MIKNNKGFMLAEAIVAGSVIITSMVLLYSTFNKLYSLYEEKNNYYNIDGIYATKAMINYLMNNDFEKFINDKFISGQYYVIIDDSNCYGDDVCDKVKSLYNVNKMIIAEYDKTALLKNINNLSLNYTFKEYIEYVNGYYGVSKDDAGYTYIVLTELKDGDSYYYSNLGIG